MYANGKLVLSVDGMTVYDAVNDVTWLADANLPATTRFTLAAGTASGQVTPSGSMGYQTAVAWVAAMNAARYLAHTNWQIPTSPSKDKTCGRTGPHGESFGFGCSAGALASLYKTLGFAAPNTAVPMPSISVGPFTDLQPYLYWSQSVGGGPTDACKSSPDGCGQATFSFSTGFHGANTKPNFLYVLPAIKGKLPGTPPASGTKLQVSPDRQPVYDSMTDRTWLANANLAASNTLGIERCKDPLTPPICVAQDGAMTYETATQFVAKMNASAHLGQKNWELPSLDASCPNFRCAGDKNPMGNLFYAQLGFSQGKSVATPPDVASGPYRHLQPYLYWTCAAAAVHDPCSADQPVPNQEWSFSFGSGFQGTDILENELYVTAYYPGK